MITKAIARYIRISPRKTRKVLDLIRGLSVVKAESILGVVNKKPALYVKRLLHSAVDNAEKNHNILPADLYISTLKADEGPMLKRFRAASMGRATSIKHRTSHITIELDIIKRPNVKKAELPTEPKVKKTRKIVSKDIKKGTKKAKLVKKG
jgi:large subunit ribosomal protein L22